MNLEGKVAVVTGGAGGIGSALARRFIEEGARAVVVADVREATNLPDRTRAVVCNTADDAAVKALVEDVESKEGPIDLYCSNAGIAVGADVTTADDVWNQVWQVNVMGSVVAARHMVPRWLERGGGYLLITASAAGLLTTLGDAAYATTKHAAVGLAEWISITYGDRGVKVSCLCPQGVKTRMVLGEDGEGQIGAEQVKRLGLIEPEEVAQAVIEALAEERFLVLPHPEVLQYFRNKAENYGRWLGGMRKFQRSLSNTSG